MNSKPFWRLWLPLAALTADLAWSLGALAPQAGANPAASVAMANSVVWIFLHMPAVLLGGLPFKDAAAGPPPRAELLLIGGLALLQAAAIGWVLGWILDRKRKP